MVRPSAQARITDMRRRVRRHPPLHRLSLMLEFTLQEMSALEGSMTQTLRDVVAVLELVDELKQESAAVKGL